MALQAASMARTRRQRRTRRYIEEAAHSQRRQSRSRARRPQRTPTTIELLPYVAGDPVGGSRVPAHQFDRFAQLESLLAVGRGHGGAYQ